MKNIAVILKFVFILSIVAVVGLLSGCEDKEDQPQFLFPQELIANMQNGNLLKVVENKVDSYTLIFEKGTVSLLKSEVVSVRRDDSKWITVFSFIDGRQLNVPTLGVAIDDAVRKLTLNPSGYAPLAVELQLSFPVAGRVRAVVRGKNGSNGNISHLFPENSANQVINVLGLYPDYENTVDIFLTDNDGNERCGTSIKVKTAPMEYLYQLKIKVKESKPALMEEGLTLISFLGSNELDTDTPFMIDAEGEIRWFLALKGHKELGNIQTHTGLQRLKNGNFLCADIKTSRIIEMDMLANVVKTWDIRSMGYRFHHEVITMPNDNFLVLVDDDNTYNANGINTVEDVVIEVDHQTGKVLTRWDLKKSLDETRSIMTDPVDWTEKDWAHSNGIAYSPSDDCIIVSCRYQGVVKLDRNNNVKWILAPHKGWNKGIHTGRLLNPVDINGKLLADIEVTNGDKAATDFDWSWGGHNPSILADGSLMMFDNGYFRHYKGNNLSDFRNPENYSRSVIYRIDENNMTVRQMWQYGKERKRDCWAVAVSSTQYLGKKQNVLFCPGVGTANSGGFGGKVVEVSKYSKEVVFELELTSPTIMIFHRATRLPLYCWI